MHRAGRLPVDDPPALIRELLRRDFGSFLIRAFPYINGGAQIQYNWHLDAIAHQLARIMSGDNRRLLVTLPPRNLKSIAISVAWVAWMLGRDPTLNFVCVSYSGELAAKLARDCRAIINSAWFRELFPTSRISDKRSATHDFEMTAGGGRLATSITGTLTGRGGDIIIIDDPIKPDEAMSEATRNAVNEWFHSTLASRLNDKGKGAIITVMQRLHQYDLAGLLLETGEWDHLCLPAIATEDQVIPLSRGRKYLRKEGEVLHVEREPRDVLDRLRASLGSMVFSAQYQQQPVPMEGNMVRAEWLQTYDATPQGSEYGEVVQSWDTATKDGIHNDWSVCITAFVQRNRVWITDVYRKRMEFPDLKRNAIRLARDYQARALLVEDQASGTQLIQMLRKEQPSGVPRPIPRKPEGDKLSRLAGITAMIEAGQLLLPAEAPWLLTFKQELLAFPSGRHDDQVDALSQLMNWMVRRPEPAPVACGPIIFWTDKYGQTWQSGDPFDSDREGPFPCDDYDDGELY